MLLFGIRSKYIHVRAFRNFAQVMFFSDQKLRKVTATSKKFLKVTESYEKLHVYFDLKVTHSFRKPRAAFWC